MISGENSISELKQLPINGTKLEVMIRGADIKKPVVIFVHGGPGCSEIPYVRKYQDLLEQDFTIVHYDQRGSGKSYHFFEDYSALSADLLTEDLLALTDYVTARFNQKPILIGHSYGTYLATKAASRTPEKFRAYVGIGQMSDLIASETDSLNFCIAEASAAQNTQDQSKLQRISSEVQNGSLLCPRSYVRKYGGAARLINENADYLQGFLLGSEYNLLDVLRYHMGISASQDMLIAQAYSQPLPEIATTLELPFYFVMGKYDFMTSAAAAKDYFDSIATSHTKEFLIYEQSAHYPQFEQKEQFSHWMRTTFASPAA